MSTRSVADLVLELCACTHDLPERFTCRHRKVETCSACGAVRVDDEHWTSLPIVAELEVAYAREAQTSLDEPRGKPAGPVGELFDLCRCGHDRGEHMSVSPYECDQIAHLGNPHEGALVAWPCACKKFELAKKPFPDMPGVVDAEWEDKTPADVVNLAEYRVRK